MDHQQPVRVIVVVQSGLVLREDEVWLEADNIVQESSELVDLTLDDDIWS